jgi:hypothetical protein
MVILISRVCARWVLTFEKTRSPSVVAISPPRHALVPGPTLESCKLAQVGQILSRARKRIGRPGLVRLTERSAQLVPISPTDTVPAKLR